MRALFLSLMLLSLAACGFSPMYAPLSGGGPAIGPVEVSLIQGKSGHVLETELNRILDITLLEQISPLGLRRDESATRAQLQLTANYVLTPANGDERSAIRGSVVTVVTYDIPTAAFGEISAQDDARERAAETMAERFRAELALRVAQQRDEAHGR
jgi:LPS-assembly lipoprotein